MERQTVKAEVRETGKKGILSQLRTKGRVPAVLYGHDFKPLSVSVDTKELGHAIRTAGLNSLLNLDGVAGQGKKPLVVMIKDLQTDAISRRIIHLDFMKVDMKEKLTVSIPIHLTGKAIGLTKGGLVELHRREIEVRCLPGNIPESIVVEISAMDIGDNIHINDLKLPEGVEIPHEQNFTIVSVLLPREEKPAEAPAVAGAEGAVEGAAAPAAGAEGAPAAPAGTAKPSKEDKGK
jgi:large subunit ribosomal protein L25